MRIGIRSGHLQTLRAPLSPLSAFFHNFSSLFRQAPISLLFCSFTGLLAGVGLSLMTDLLQVLPGLIILIPPAIDMRGNIYSALVSRLGTSMHLGLFSPTLKKGGVVYQNAYTSFILTLFLSVILGFLAKIVADAFGMPSISLQGFILISVIGGVISGTVLFLVALLIALIGYQRSWDLDNMSSPIITSAGDMVTIPCLFLATLLLIKLGLLNTSGNSRGWIAPETLVSLIFTALAVGCMLKGLKANDVVIRRIIIESIPMLIIAGMLSTLAGITLNGRLEHLIALPALLLIVPPFLGESNGLSGILSARLSSMLHIGTANPKPVPEKLVVANFAVIYLLSVLLFLVVGLTSYLASRYLGMATPPLSTMLLIAFFGGILCTTFLNFASYYIAILSFRFGLDPDNDTIPLITSLTDIVGVFCLLFSIHLMM